MGFGRYLRRRGTRWFFRYRWPVRLAKLGISGEVILRLGTANYRVALHRARILRVEVERLVAQFTPALSKREAEALVRTWIDKCFWLREARRAETNGFDILESDEISRMQGNDARELDALLRVCDRLHAEQERKEIEKVLAGRAPMDRFGDLISAVGSSLWDGFDLATPEGRLLGRTILRGYATLLTELRETVAAIPHHLAAAPSRQVLPRFPFLQFWPDFERYKVSTREWKSDTRSNSEATKKLFERFFPKASADKVFDGRLASDFKEKYLQLPRCYDKNPDWKGWPLGKIIEDTQNPKASPRINPNSSNKHISNLSEYCAFLMLKKHVPSDLKNPFDGLFTPRKKGKAARGDHDMWPVDLDRKFFSSPIYSGCKSIHRRFEPGKEIHRDALFWVPLLGRTMGGREDEFCSRKVGDIAFAETEIGPVAYLKIRDSKTDSSARDVPFHDEVLDVGFLEYRYYGRAPEEPLFPELIAQGPGERRSAAFTGRFAYARQKTDVLRTRVDFRSYRDTVQTVLSNTEGVNAGWIDELIGHESIIRRSEGARYTKVVYMPILKRTIDKVRLPVDLSHLKYNSQRGVPADGAADEIKRYVTLAQREMNKKNQKEGIDAERTEPVLQDVNAPAQVHDKAIRRR
jgi:hypothetical protein